MLVPTVTIGPLRPTAATTVTISTSIRATGTGTTTIGLTASPSVPSPKHLQTDGLFLSLFRQVPWENGFIFPFFYDNL